MIESKPITPYETSLEQLQDQLGLSVLYLRRYIGRYAHRMLQAEGRLSDLHVSLGEARGWLTGAPLPVRETRLSRVSHWPEAGEIDAEIDAFERHCEARRASSLGAERPPELAIEKISEVFRLSPDQLRLLVAAAAPSLSVDLARLYTFAWADFGLKAPSVGFLCELLASEPGDSWALVEELTPSAPLVRHRLVVVGEAPHAPSGGPQPMMARSVTVPEAVVAFMRGAMRPLEEVVGDRCQWHLPGGALRRDEVVLPQESLRGVERALRRCLRPGAGDGLVLLGPARVGRGTTLEALLAEVGFGVIEVTLRSMSKLDARAMDVALLTLGREAALRRSALLLRGDEIWEEGGDEAERLARALKRCWSGLGSSVALTARRFAGPLRLLEEVLVPVQFEPTSIEAQGILWSRALGEGDRALAPTLVGSLTASVDASAGAIVRAVRRARRDASGGSPRRAPLSLEQILSAHGQQTSHRLHEIAEPFQTSAQWGDLILPEETLSALKEIVTHSRHREKVFDKWGFRQKMSYGRGLSCLFAGPPGTGKTMTAGLLANVLQRPIFRIDLSRVMSKWVGETEKNLARVFDEAERSHVILLFDEADSLFGSRTEVKSANDRYANLEVNYLLQRMEQYDGVTVLTTNFDKGIDEAFKRRIRFRVTFPFPDASARERLWRSMLPVSAPVSDDVDFEELAAHYELSGGNIKNAVLRAAFLAAQEESPIGFDQLERAAALEAREMGMLVREERGW